MESCKACNVFEAYEGDKREPINCAKFLCNDGTCPFEKQKWSDPWIEKQMAMVHRKFVGTTARSLDIAVKVGLTLNELGFILGALDAVNRVTCVKRDPEFANAEWRFNDLAQRSG